MSWKELSRRCRLYPPCINCRLRTTTKGKAGKDRSLPRFRVSKHSYKKQWVKKWGRILDLAMATLRLVPLDKICIFMYFFFRNHQQNVKVLWKRTCEAKRIYDLKCREEVASNQFYHQEVARCGKISKEAEKVSIVVLM